MPALAQDGLALGAGMLLAERGASGALDLYDRERLHALLAVCYGAPPAGAAQKLARADAVYMSGDACLAHVHLAQLGLPPIDERQAFAGFLADRLLKAGLAPAALEKALGLEREERFGKYDPDQPRDERGRWTSGGAGSADAEPAVREGRSVSPGGPEGGDRSEDEKLYEERRELGETTPEEDRRHGRPIDPLDTTPLPLGAPRPASGPKPATGGLPSKTEFLGSNPQPGGSRWNTDLPGGKAEAEALFEQLRGSKQKFHEFDDAGSERIWTEDHSVQLRMKANGDIRIERQIDIGGKQFETIHFGGKGNHD
ncbi:hypothetical protein [Methylocella sp.]|uniref:hypothetical protein n=1 Tax=Methylocella sp. TaxID=1978226 RepID=UPI0035B3E51E